MNAIEKNVEVMLDLFRAVERGDDQAVLACCHPQVEFLWPPSLPYGGDSAHPREGRPTWSETWAPLQPSDAERSLEPRIVAAAEQEVVILWALGFAVHIGGGLIHLLLVIALIVAIVRLIQGRSVI